MVIDSSANGSITTTTLLTDLNGYFNDTLLLELLEALQYRCRLHWCISKHYPAI